ncbi:hypothetical protein D3C80_194590 [compost metagenome]
MGKGHELFQTECTGTTLDGMNGAENGVDRLGIAIPIVQLEKTGFQFSELLFAFLKKDLFDFVHIHRKNSRFRRLHARSHQ